MLHAPPRAAIAIPLPKRLARDTRRQMVAAIEQHQNAMEGLIAILDLFDGDPDLEANGDHEPNQGYSPPHPLSHLDDLDESCEDEGSNCDDEGAAEGV